jgi:hypothetical protein
MTKVVKVILEAETGKANANLNKVNKSLKTTEKQAKETSGAMTSAFNALPASIQGAIGQVKNLGTSFKALAVGGGVAAIAGLGSLFVMATKKGAEFAKALSGLEAVLGASDSEMNQLSNSAKELGASTQFTSKQVVELQTEFAKLGFSTKEILASTKATLDLAASLDVGLGEAAQIAGSTLRAFGLEAEETQRVVDVMASSTSKSALDYDSLRESLKLVAPTSRAMNVSIEETTALLATLADNGLKGSIAGTGLSKTFIELNKKGIPLNEALERVKNSSNALNEAIDLVGVVGAKSLLTLANNAPKIDVLTESFRNSQGAAQRLAETRLDNLAGDTTKLGSAWEGFLLSIEDGEGLFNSIARGIVQATTSLLNFITPTEKLSESLEKERASLFRVQAQLGNVNTTQEERTSLILELQKQYPNYLKNIDAETASNEDLNKAIQEINKSLINKILIQEREEEIQEQAQETADELNKVLDKEAELDRLDVKMQDTTLSEEDLEKAQQDRVAVIDELKLKYPKYLKDIDSETTSTEDLKKAIDQVNESLINKIIIQEKEEEILEQAEDTAARRLKLDEKQQDLLYHTNKLRQEFQDLGIKIKATSPNEVLEELNGIVATENKLRNTGNGLAKTKIGQISRLQTLMNNLKFKIKNVNKAEEDYNEEQSITNKLIEEKEALMKRLKIETEETTDKTEESNGATIEEIESNKSLIKIQEDLLELYKQMPETTEKQLAEKNVLIDTVNKEIKRLKSLGIEQKKQKKNQVEEIEVTNELNKKLLDQIEIKEDLVDLDEEEEEPVFETDFLKNTEKASKFQTEVKIGAIVNEIEREKQLRLQQLLWNKENIIEQSILDGTYSAQQKIAIEKDFQRKKSEIEIEADEKTKRQKIDNQNKILNATSSALSSIGQIADAFARGDEERAKKAFKINKAVGIAQATISTAQGIMNELSHPVKTLTFTNYAAAAAMALAGAAQIATIATTKFNSGSSVKPSINDTTGGGSLNAATQPPSFNVVGQSGFNQVAGALGQQQPVQAYVVAGNVTTAQQLQNNTITQATF